MLTWVACGVQLASHLVEKDEGEIAVEHRGDVDANLVVQVDDHLHGAHALARRSHSLANGHRAKRPLIREKNDAHLAVRLGAEPVCRLGDALGQLCAQLLVVVDLAIDR